MTMPAPVTPIGLDCKLYRNTGTWSTPIWNEIPTVGDVTIPLSKGEAEMSTRGSRWKTRKGTLKDASIDFQVKLVKGDIDLAALLASFVDGTPIELLALDGPVATAGSQGLRAVCEVFKFDNGQPLEGAVVFDVSAKPCPAENEPVWFTTP
jgi:hypothetical protein